MTGDVFEITIEDALGVIERVTSENRKNQPLAGKEAELLTALMDAHRAHDEAIINEDFRRTIGQPMKRLKNVLQNALDELGTTPINLACLDPELDDRYLNPESKSDLPGLLRRALLQLSNEGLVKKLLDRRDQSGKISRAVRSHPENISSVGIHSMVEVLFDFWDRETGLPFSDDFYKAEDRHGNDGPLRPKGLAAKFVYESVRIIDPGYTAEACSNAMRPR